MWFNILKAQETISDMGFDFDLPEEEPPEEEDNDYAETEEERENREKSYFNADLTEDDSWSYKSKKKEKDPFGEFTHLFKGL